MSFWYLATPYSKYKDGPQAASDAAARIAGDLIRQGIHVYSPIAHSHTIATNSKMDLHDYDIWLPLDEQFMKASCGIIVAQMDGWDKSKGIQWEIDWYKKNKKPIVYIHPGELI